MFTLSEPPLFTRLRSAERVLIAGAGGGFDVYAGLPLALSLWNEGRTAYLASFSFSYIESLPREVWLAEDVAEVTPGTQTLDWYFPEGALSRWLERHELPSTVYAFPQRGVQPLRDAYRALVEHLDVDAIVLVDGGTDILMRGDEHGLGTPTEDMASLAAVHGLDVPEKIVLSLGFGIDYYHGVNHVHVLENLAALDREGAYLGAFSIPRDSREAALYQDAVAHAAEATPDRPSIVHGSIAAALRGECGDVRFTDRTRGSELFVNPLMAMYFGVDLNALADRLLYRDLIEDTRLTRQITSIIEEYRETHQKTRPPRQFPH